MRGTFETIDDDGRLIVRAADGSSRTISRRRSAFRRRRDGGAMTDGSDGRAGLRAARRRRRDRHEPRPLRLRPRAQPRMARRRHGRRLRPRGSARRRRRAARHPLPRWSARTQLAGIVITPRARGPLRRADRFLAAARGAGLHDAVRGRRCSRPSAPASRTRRKSRSRSCSQREPFTVGPFEVEYIPVSHSIPEPNALAIRTPLGTVLHTGDWKLDPAPGLGPRRPTSDRLAALGAGGRAGARLRFHQRHPRRRQPERRRGRRWCWSA